ncbi:MAG: RagB/SusD family nutrient uptake outer membrane protein [Gemmatimonadota bacterium]
MTVLKRCREVMRAARLAVVGAVFLTACSSILDVTLPGKVTSDDLNDPALAAALANGVVITFECAWTSYVAAANALSDEVLSASGQANTNVWGLRGILSNNVNLLDNCDANAGGYAALVPLQQARVLADNAAAKLAAYPDAVVTNKAFLLAQVKTYGAYATLPLGEGFCQQAFDQGPLLSPAQALAVAETRFTDALAAATAASNADLKNMALAGRARVRLDLGNFAGARADAELVTAGYVKNATRGATERQRWNLLYELQNNDGSVVQRHVTIAPAFRDVQWQGVADPRVKVTATGQLSADGVTPWFKHNKALSRSDPVLIASSREARLIIAEAAARGGDLTTARQIINDLHTAAAIPGYDSGNTATQAEIITQIIDERSRELFLEVGARYSDHLRFRATQWNIPFRGEPGSVHPNGVDQRGQQYGTTTCIPLTDAETLGR